jgi:hypothetical protein
MTRDERDLRGLIVDGSDHLTAYNVFAEAVRRFGIVGSVYGLPRHVFRDEIADWCEQRGVLLKALEDIALGTASVYRAIELPLPGQFPAADRGSLSTFRDVIARVTPFTVAIDGQLANGDEVRISQGSFCSPGVVAGNVRYFADRFGNPRASIEGTNIPFDLVRRYATKERPEVAHHRSRKSEGLFLERASAYAGFTLDRVREPLPEPFAEEWRDAAHDAIARALLTGQTGHPNGHRLSQLAARVDEYWRRSGGALAHASPDGMRATIRRSLGTVSTWAQVLATPVALHIDSIVPSEQRELLDALPDEIGVSGGRAWLRYEIERGQPVVYLSLKESLAKRLRSGDLPRLDRPIRFELRDRSGRRVRAGSVEELRRMLDPRTKRRARTR